MAEDENEEEDNKKEKTLYEQTNEATAGAKKIKEELTEVVNRAEELYEKQKLGGTTEAGQSTESETKEETNQEYVDRVSKAGWKDDRK